MSRVDEHGQTLNSIHLVPRHWIKGQLLDVRRYSDGSYIVTLLGEELDEDTQTMKFNSTIDAQAFVSNWYAR
jgi:hypothetical protein